jgi:DNA-binding NarL/FixJ family response regulator
MGDTFRTVPATVLIVDDHPSFRASARRLLEAEGYQVVGEAPDGESAIASAAALAPDLVLLDVALPDLDGFEVARRLTAHGDLAVVLTSSRDWSAIGSLVADSGARGFVAKDDLSGAALAALVG